MRRLLLVLALGGCFKVDNPPQASITDLADGILPDATKPVVLGFNEPVVPGSLRARIIRYETDAEGNLFDEDDDPATDLAVLYDSADDTGGKGELDGARQSFTITLAKPLPVGPQLALLVDPGLSDDLGHAWVVRQVLKFGYRFSCKGGKPTTFPTSGKYFFVIAVDKPVPIQVRLFADMRVDAMTGEMLGQFTNGRRDPMIDCKPYGLSCTADEVCRTLPTPACVAQSEKAGTVEEYPDFFADDASKLGFTFTVHGCFVDQPDGTFSFANLPVTAVIKQPAVTVEGIELTSSWKLDDMKVMRGGGSFVASGVSLGPNPSGKGTGTHVERKLPDSFTKPIPPPPAK